MGASVGVGDTVGAVVGVIVGVGSCDVEGVLVGADVMLGVEVGV